MPKFKKLEQKRGNEDVFIETESVEKRHNVSDLLRVKARLQQRILEVDALLAEAKKLGIEVPDSG